MLKENRLKTRLELCILKSHCLGRMRVSEGQLPLIETRATVAGKRIVGLVEYWIIGKGTAIVLIPLAFRWFPLLQHSTTPLLQ